MIEEIILKKAVAASFEAAKKLLRQASVKLLSTKDNFEEAISLHLKAVKNWSEEVSFSDLKRAKRTTDIYIELDLFVYPKRIRINPQEDIETIPLLNIFDDYHNHFVLLGHPGAGKTTSMKYLCQQLFYNPNFHTDKFSFPILIKLRELNNKIGFIGDSIIDKIFSLLGLKIEFPKEMQIPEANADRRALKEKIVITVLDDLNALLILDGFDELVQADSREQAVQEIRYLVEHLDRCTLIATSRTGDFKYYIENMIPYEISPLSQNQISTFALKWLNDERIAMDFIEKVYSSPFADTTIRPLTLAHLCAIYERIGKIPDKPKTIYRKIINLLLEEWDQQRSVKRESSYAFFEVDRKFEFLCQLAYVLTTQMQETIFSEGSLLSIYHQICEDYGLGQDEAPQVVSELESHTGLFIQSGYEQYEFAHKSLQEFLAAEYLVKLPRIPSDIGVLSRIPNELAIATTISSSPSEYFSDLIFNSLAKKSLSEEFIKKSLSEEFIRSFVNRLLLEKPDFNSNTQLSVALFFLYSAYIQVNGLPREGNQSKLFYFDPMVGEFEKLIKIVVRKSSLEIIQKSYVVENTYTAGDGSSIYRLMKNLGMEYDLFSSIPDMPYVLYVRSSFLDISPS